MDSNEINKKLEEQHSLEQTTRQLKERIASLQQEKQRLEVEVERVKMEISSTSSSIERRSILTMKAAETRVTMFRLI
jgi:chromosome segregation ATPase